MIHIQRSFLVIVVVFLFTGVFSASAASIRGLQNSPRKGVTQGREMKMTASWYGGKFHGGRTASGEYYNMYKMNAAHKTLPMGTILRVRNLNNNRTVVVTINNRGPYIRGRDLDLSYAAASKLGITGAGVGRVGVSVIGHDKRYDAYLRNGHI